MKIGYARVSTREQNLSMQVMALEESGCDRIYEEVVSGVKADRPILKGLLSQLRPGDTLVIWGPIREKWIGFSCVHIPAGPIE